MNKDVFVDSILPNTTVDSLFVIENPSLKTSKKGKYIACNISDSTGKISCRIWGGYNPDVSEIENVHKKILLHEGLVFRISGKADRYNNELNINVNDGISYLKSPADIKNMDDSDYIYSPADIAGNKKKITALIESIQNQGLKDLVFTVIKKSNGFYEKPAAKTKHHNYTGGLAEHSLEVAGIAQSIGENLASVKLNRDTLLAGAILHDIGKCDTFEKKGLYYSPTPSYSLLGHITPAMQTLSRYTSFVDADTYQDLLHIIQSHHGEYGDTRPQTPEAWAVHFADNISATMHEISEDLKNAETGELLWGKRMDGFVFKSKNSGEDTLPDKKTTDDQKKQKTISDCF